MGLTNPSMSPASSPSEAEEPKKRRLSFKTPPVPVGWSLPGQCFAKQDEEALSMALEKNTTVKSLDFGHNKITDTGAQVIAGCPVNTENGDASCAMETTVCTMEHNGAVFSEQACAQSSCSSTPDDDVETPTKMGMEAEYGSQEREMMDLPFRSIIREDFPLPQATDVCLEEDAWYSNACDHDGGGGFDDIPSTPVNSSCRGTPCWRGKRSDPAGMGRVADVGFWVSEGGLLLAPNQENSFLSAADESRQAKLLQKLLTMGLPVALPEPERDVFTRLVREATLTPHSKTRQTPATPRRKQPELHWSNRRSPNASSTRLYIRC